MSNLENKNKSQRRRLLSNPQSPVVGKKRKKRQISVLGFAKLVFRMKREHNIVYEMDQRTADDD